MHESVLSTQSVHLAYTLAILLFDVFDALTSILRWSAPKRPASDYAPSDSKDLADDQILELFATKPPLTLPYAETSGIVCITEGTATKVAQDFEEDIDEPSEAVALDMVFLHTTIPVPRVHRVVKFQWSNIIVMDFIPGQTLSEAWPSLSFLGRLRVAITLRRYIRQLRAIRHPRSAVPGPLAIEGSRRCESPLFGQVVSSRGPFASYQELSAFFNERFRMFINSKEPLPPSTTKFDDSAPLVLTHQDINPRNLIMGDDGLLWMIDWAWSGFYPRWFEFVAMKCQAENEELVVMRKEPMWDAVIPFVCNPYYGQEKWLYGMARAFCWV